MPVNVAANLLLQGARGMFAAPEAYRQEGPSGVAQAFMNPQPYEQSARQKKLRDQNSELLSSIQMSVQDGNLEMATSQVVALREKMKAAGARPADIDAVSGSALRDAAQIGLSRANLESPQGQRQALNVSAVAAPEKAANVAEIGATLPTRRMGPQVTEAEIGQRQAETRRIDETAQNLIPAQAGYYRANTALSGARAGAYERGDFARRGNTVQDMFGKNANVLSKYDKPLGEMVRDPMANPEQIRAEVDKRNFFARNLGMPEVEMIMAIDPTADASLPVEQRQVPMIRMKETAQQPAAQQQPKQEQPPPLLPYGTGTGPGQPGAEATPTDPLATLPQQQRRSDFQAAVQNPLGVLPEPLQRALVDPNQIVDIQIGRDTFTQMGYSPQESDALLSALSDQILGGQAPSPHPSASPAPFQTPGAMTPLAQPSPRPRQF